MASETMLLDSNVIPQVPGDNSHYVEGQSQYIWMPDGDGNPQLVDLYEPADEAILRTRNGANNQYWLYTSDGNSAINPAITSAYLAVQDVNVIVVDWRALANSAYSTAAGGVPNVGQFLGNFLVWLINTGGGNWNSVHLIGFSLGAHVVASAGRIAGGRAMRITGLDPAGPTWQNNGNALSSNAGQYVEAIHTDGGLLGIFNRVADADFYPNGGRNPQPGCWISTCSHSRAWDLFASTVRSNHLVGRLCANINQAENKRYLWTEDWKLMAVLKVEA
ncbi:Neutral lipase [Operophtera brumata]|uniref:Neutral lipase n=1 Tax=Operophtera brumata TaxID=104452 RepID=A0A0L7L3Q3_OPEBR|nr:Neutral lipase [Operophtera brumata]